MQPVINIESWINKLQYSKALPGFRDGQIFAGKIIKFYPNQMAEVLVNGTKLVAKMEVPVEAHVRQLFQVNQSESGLIQLKVLPFGNGHSTVDLPNQLLSLFHIKTSKVGTTLAEMVIDNQMAVTKESFKTALDWVNSAGDSSRRLHIVRLALLNQLPIHHTTLNALLSLDTGKPLTAMLETLSAQLRGFSDSGRYFPLVKSLDELLQTGKSEAFQKIAGSLIDEGAEIIQKAGIVLKDGQAVALNNDHNRLMEWIERVYKGNTTRPPELTGEEWLRIQDKIINNDPYIHLNKSNTVHKALISILQSLGIGGIEDQSNLHRTGALKDMLLQLMVENTPPQLKNHAEAILTRLTAFQLLSQETGPLQNVFMQIPIPFAELKNDLTLQWTGRKQEDGKIDPAYCRIVFYLELSNLKETVIDMNIQNRIISLKIWTEEEEEANRTVTSLLPMLKENLEEKGYHLTTVKIEDFSQRKSVNSGLDKPYYPHPGYSGVDYKI